MNSIIHITISIILGYILGSIPTGVILSRLAGNDIRKKGNGHPGAAHIFRELSPIHGVITALLDCTKGILAYSLILFVLHWSATACIIACSATVIGHNWSIFLRFKGGDGVGVISGINAVFFPWLMLIMIGEYLLFLLFWYLRIKPFYLYHAYNWQTVFLTAPIIIVVGGNALIPSYSRLTTTAAIALSISFAIISIIKQAQTHGISFLWHPSEFNNKYADRIRKKS